MKAIIVMSGGQDSTTVLGQVLQHYEPDEVLAITFAYGQKHSAELQAAAFICGRVGVCHRQIDMSPVLENMKSSALINHGDVRAEHPLLPGRPASFVPARNALFLTAAYGIALEVGAETIWTGVCQTDYSGYPDCRSDFVEHLQLALNIGYEQDIKIMTPLMYLTKAQTFLLAEKNGMLNDVLNYSVTCYEGVTDSFHEWGNGCGECPACKLRAQGWHTYRTYKEIENV